MKFQSALMTEARGSVGGATFSRNKSGLYIRAKAVPVNPQTSAQVAARNALANVVARWSQTVTEENRAAFGFAASGIFFPDGIGGSHTLSPIAFYTRINALRIQLGLTPKDDIDDPFDYTAQLNPMSFAVTASTGNVSVTFDDAQEWVDEDESAIAVYASRPQRPTINFFKGPYRLAGTILGDATTAPTSPATIALPFPVQAGDKVFFQARLTRVNGGLSTPFRAGIVAT